MIVGYSRSREAEIALRVLGVPEKTSFLEGRGAETLRAAIACLRGRGTLFVGATAESRTIGEVRVVGLPPGLIEGIVGLTRAIKEAPTLRALFGCL